jgi:response regulator NasT
MAVTPDRNKAAGKPVLPGFGGPMGNEPNSEGPIFRPPAPSSGTLEAPAGGVTLAGKRVVICEDEAVTQMQLRRALSRAGLQVVGIATNGKEAVDTTLREKPDIVLMDIRMPVMDGITAARKIMDSYPVCMVMLTAFANDGYQEQAKSLGAAGYIVKPITSDVLLPLLEDALANFESGHS